jgi:hypothetical protein
MSTPGTCIALRVSMYGDDLLLLTLGRNWWMVAVRGILAVLFGVLMLSSPDASLNLLVGFFGLYALLDGAWASASQPGEGPARRLGTLPPRTVNPGRKSVACGIVRIRLIAPLPWAAS